MKQRIFLTLLTLCLCMGGLAQTLPFEFSTSKDATDAKWYSIQFRNQNGNTYAYVANESSTQLGQSTNGNSLTVDQKAFCFVQNGEGFYIYNKGTGKAVYVDAVTDRAPVKVGNTPTLIKYRLNGSDHFLYDAEFSPNVNNTLASWSNTDAFIAISAASSRSNYNGSRAVFTKIFAGLADGIYEINNQSGSVSRGYFAHSATYPNAPVLAETLLNGYTERDVTNNRHDGTVNPYFGVKTVNGRTYIYSLANGKFLNTSWSDTAVGYTIETSTRNQNYVTLQNTQQSGTQFLCNACGNNGGVDGHVIYTGNNDGGNDFVFEPVSSATATDLQTTYAANIAAAEFVINGGWTINYEGLAAPAIGGVCYKRVNYTGNKVSLPYSIDSDALIAMHVSGYNGSVDVNDATKTITVTYSSVATAGPTLWSDNNNNANLPAARIPALVKSQDYILAFSDWRYNRNDIGRGDNGKRIDIEVRRSHDNGLTWEPAIIVAQGTGITADGYSAAHGDAAVVADRESDKVLMLAASGNTTDFSGSTRTNPIKIGKFVSSNNGASWEKSELTSTIYNLFPESVTKIFVSSGKILQGSVKKDGASNYRIYAVLCTNEGNHVIYSDDFGTSWGTLGNACTAGNEAHVTELPNGDLLLDSRTNGARYVNVYTYANKQDGKAVLGSDVSQGSWGTYGTMGIPTSGDGCNGDIDIMTAYPKGSNEPVKVLLQTSPRSGRNNVSYYYMRLPEPTNDQYNVNDFVGAAKWTSGYEVFHGASAYTSIFHDDQGDVHMLLEENNTNSTWSYNMTYEKHNISLITNGNYFGVDPTGEKTIKFTLTDDNGTTYEGETTGTIGTTPTFTGCDGMTFNKVSWGMEDEKATYTANVVFPFPVSSNSVDNWTCIGSFESENHLWFAKNGGLKLDIDKMPTNNEQVNNSYKWAIYPVNDGLKFSFKIKNADTNTYLASANTSTSSAFALAQEGYAYTFKTHLTNKKGFYYESESKFITFNSSAYSGEQNAWLWSASGSHNGSNLKFVAPSDFNALMEQLQAAMLCPGTEGDKVGQYSASNATEEQKTLAQNIINGTEYATAAKFQELTNAISYALNMPQPGYFYRLKGVATSKYITCTNALYNNNENVYEMADDKTTGDNVKNTIIYYGTDNKFVMFGNGFGFSNGMQASLNANTTFTFQADTQGGVGKYNVKGVYGNNNTIFLWNYSTNIARNGSVTPQCVWEVEEVTELPINIATSGYTTFYSPVNVVISAPATAYIANVNESDFSITFTEVNNGIIPAGCAVLVSGDGGSVATVAPTNDTESYTSDFIGKEYTQAYVAGDFAGYNSTIGGNALAGKHVYTLQNGTFKKYNGDKLTGFKAHLELADLAAGARDYTIVLPNGEETGLEEFAEKVTGSRDGIFVENGKIVIRKNGVKYNVNGTRK